MLLNPWMKPAAIVAAGTGIGLVAGIEAASCAAYAFGMLFPWF